MSDLMKLIGDYAEQRVASSLLVQDRDADAAESFAIEDRFVREITDAHAAEIRRAKADALRESAEFASSGLHCLEMYVAPPQTIEWLKRRADEIEDGWP